MSWQTALQQMPLAPHEMPQPPQLLGSLVSLTQEPPQLVVLAVQQTPLWQLSPAGQAVQLLPQ